MSEASVVPQQVDAPTEFVAAASLSDVPPGWVLNVRIGSTEIALANRGEEIHALDTYCTHAGGPIGDSRLKSDCFVECPWHGAAFDVRDGMPQPGPSRKPLRTYPVKVADGTIFVALSGRS